MKLLACLKYTWWNDNSSTDPWCLAVDRSRDLFILREEHDRPVEGWETHFWRPALAEHRANHPLPSFRLPEKQDAEVHSSNMQAPFCVIFHEHPVNHVLITWIVNSTGFCLFQNLLILAHLPRFHDVHLHYNHRHRANNCNHHHLGVGGGLNNRSSWKSGSSLLQHLKQ